MNKAEFISTIEKLNLPNEDFGIISGGSLLMRGIRDTTSDFDLAITQSLANKINLYSYPRDSKGFYMLYDSFQVLDNYDSFDFDVIDGYRCESLSSILFHKRQRSRPKDLDDIRRIEFYLRSRV